MASKLKPLIALADVDAEVIAQGLIWRVTGPDGLDYVCTGKWFVPLNAVKIHAKLAEKIQPAPEGFCDRAAAAFMGPGHERTVKLGRTSVLVQVGNLEPMRLYANGRQRQWVYEDQLDWLGQPAWLYLEPKTDHVRFLGVEPGVGWCAGVSEHGATAQERADRSLLDNLAVAGIASEAGAELRAQLDEWQDKAAQLQRDLTRRSEELRKAYDRAAAAETLKTEWGEKLGMVEAERMEWRSKAKDAERRADERDKVAAERAVEIGELKAEIERMKREHRADVQTWRAMYEAERRKAE